LGAFFSLNAVIFWDSNMAFTACKKCHSSVSASAVICPVCSRPLDAPTDILSVTFLKWLIAISLLSFAYHLGSLYWS